MSLWTKLHSQLINVRAFRPFFPVARTMGDMLVLPAQMMRKGGRSNEFPFVININVTTRCNLRCPYCFNAENVVARSKEISLAQFQAMADDWARYRPGIFISGGEPFSRQDLVEVIAAFKAHGLPVGLVTNGTLVDEDKARRLAALGLDAFMVSVHGQREVHDKAVGIPGSFDKTMEAIRLWSRISPKPGPMVNYVITAESVADLSGFIAETSDIRRMTLRLSHLNFLTPTEVEAQKNYWNERFPDVPIDILSHQFEPDGAAFAPLLEFFETEEGRRVLTKPVLDDAEIRRWYSPDASLGRRCVFIWRSTFINAQGDVYPCQFLYVRMGNVLEEPLAEVWNNGLYRRFRDTLREGLMPGCARCCKL
ncbi:MAG: radical SAM protein [Candidatus Lernaella stagnicola]|nr:radical SAM protein [Candidatus Lernaella stagnicola]